MRKKIQTQLRRIEEEESIKILLAVESGSRAWGFASPDSDYDVRFIYIRRMEDYLKLEKVRDVIELPMDDVLDMNGWDLQKTLRLLYKSNPTLFEWFSSPIVYQETEFADISHQKKRCIIISVWRKEITGNISKAILSEQRNIFTSCARYWPANGFWIRVPLHLCCFQS